MNLLLFISGVAGLINEILWTRILAFSFGQTTYALTTVLAVFMGGLALGSRYFGKIADRSTNPVRLYAFLELGIGAYCLAAPTLLFAAGDFYHILASKVPGIVPSRTLIRFFLASLVLIVPTILMGGTLPAAVRALVENPEEAGKKVGMAYGMNTIGASAGAFSAGYLLLPAIGITKTNYLGAFLSLLAGAVALLVFSGGKTPHDIPRETESHPQEHNIPDRFLLWAFVATGAVGMSYQIVWIRALVLVIGSSTYAISAIVVTFLLGISLGSMVFARLRVRNMLGLFATTQIGIAFFALLLVPFFNLLPRIFFALSSAFDDSFRQIQFLQFFIVFLVVLPPTTLMGMAFPCLVSLLARRGETIGYDLGRFYAANTLGAMLGVLATGFLFIPFLGAQKTLILGIGVTTFLGIAIFFSRPFPFRGSLFPLWLSWVSSLPPSRFGTEGSCPWGPIFGFKADGSTNPWMSSTGQFCKMRRSSIFGKD